MRFEFQKDVVQLREQLFKKEKLGGQFKEIDVKYFDIAEGLPQEFAEILNTKIYEMKSGYQKILLELAKSNEALYQKVAILDLINSKHHIIYYLARIEDGIRFKDMTADHLIQRLSLIQSSASVVWGLIHHNYGDDFFLP